MRAAQERLPPKKRELLAAAGEEAGPGRGPGGGGGGGEASSSAASPSQWAREAAGRAGYGDGGAGGLAAEQYGGLLYKVAVPPVVSVSPLPPAFGVASPLLPQQPPGLPFSPVHYAQLPPAPLHFVGSPYSLPYALPPGFLPGPLVSASRLPHFVPYTSFLLEDAGPLAFGKTAGPLQPLEATQGSFPLHYQLPHLSAAYSAVEVPLAEQSLELPLQDPKLLTANGPERAAVGTKAPDVDSGGAGGQLPGTPGEPGGAGHFLTSCQSLRAEVPLTSRRSTPDTDLEVQRVVGLLVSQDDLSCSGRQKDGWSPLNLSHPDLPEQGEESGRNPGRAAAEKSHHQRLSAKSPEELLYHNQILRGLTMANGKVVSGSLLPASPGPPGRASPEAPAQGEPPDHSQGPLPSHFMKGAIIQLATGELKRVEELQTQDFVRSAEVSGGLKIDSSTVVDLQESPWQGFVTLHFVVGEQQSKVSIDVPPEHPFFVYGQGWSSCNPERTAQLFALPCHRLQVGDVCISISLQNLNGRLAPPATRGAARERLGRASQGVREPQARAGEGSPMQKGAAASLGSPSEASHFEPTSQLGWAGPSLHRLGEEPHSPFIRPSFIPQEVKLSIEGRSNAGK